MKEYARILFPLFMPLTGVFMVFASLYFGRENGFNEALKLGVLTGFLLAVVITPLIALFLFFIHKMKTTEPKVAKETPTKKKKDTPVEKKESSEKKPTKKKPLKPSTKQEEFVVSKREKLILLMDKPLTLNVILAAISEESIGAATQKQDEENLIISVVTNKEDMTLIITPLTKHTTELTITSSYNSEDAKKIIRYIKEKEFSFLNY